MPEGEELARSAGLGRARPGGLRPRRNPARSGRGTPQADRICNGQNRGSRTAAAGACHNGTADRDRDRDALLRSVRRELRTYPHTRTEAPALSHLPEHGGLSMMLRPAPAAEGARLRGTKRRSTRPTRRPSPDAARMESPRTPAFAHRRAPKFRSAAQPTSRLRAQRFCSDAARTSIPRAADNDGPLAGRISRPK